VFIPDTDVFPLSIPISLLLIFSNKKTEDMDTISSAFCPDFLQQKAMNKQNIVHDLIAQKEAGKTGIKRRNSL